MKRKRFTDEQIIGILSEHEAGANCADLCRTHGMSEGTFYNWKAKFGGMTASEAKRQKALLGLSERRACRIVGADRKMVRYQSQRAPDTALRGGQPDHEYIERRDQDTQEMLLRLAFSSTSTPEEIETLEGRDSLGHGSHGTQTRKVFLSACALAAIVMF